MQKTFDSIDIFFIVIISIYFIDLFMFVAIFIMDYFHIGEKRNKVIDVKDTVTQKEKKENDLPKIKNTDKKTTSKKEKTNTTSNKTKTTKKSQTNKSTNSKTKNSTKKSTSKKKSTTTKNSTKSKKNG